MYSPNSPNLSSLDHAIGHLGSSIHNHHHHHNHHQQQFTDYGDTININGSNSGSSNNGGGQCSKFKYFTTFLICTTCLALLSASLATHKWLVSKPIRILKLNGGQTNLTSLMLTANQLEQPTYQSAAYHHNQSSSSNHHHQPPPSSSHRHLPSALLSSLNAQSGFDEPSLITTNYHHQNNKFQGEIYFGLFQGIKVLNYGFGDRINSISVIQTVFAKDNQQELINFKLWLLTVASVVLAILFALIGSIFAIINFVMTPRGTLTGPIGLVIWNAAACFSCLLAMISWLIEYFIRLQANVLTFEEVQNGWTSENRSQFGYSYYFVILAFVLHLVNIFIVSLVQFEIWTGTGGGGKANKRQTRSVCEGVIMLY